MKDNVTKTVSFASMAFAVVFAGFYIVSAYTLYVSFVVNTPADAKAWERAWYIFSGIQSAGLSAIGVLLGVAVQQPRVADAKAQANKAKDAIQKTLDANDDEAGGGVSLDKSNKLTTTARSILMEGLKA
jgi:hypothetical protein